MIRHLRVVRLPAAALSLVPLVTGPLSAAGCARGDALAAQQLQLADRVAEARAAGARRCAPTELALAEAHLRFAEIDAAQGDLDEAEDHLRLAEPNASAALALSREGGCAEDTAAEP